MIQLTLTLKMSLLTRLSKQVTIPVNNFEQQSFSGRYHKRAHTLELDTKHNLIPISSNQ